MLWKKIFRPFPAAGKLSDLEQARLAEAFCPPPPDKKENFVASLPRQRISNARFLLIQAGYLPLWVWGVCLLPFPLLLLNAWLMAKSTLWMLSALIPFVAMSAVAENTRSALHHMAELEMASRFSLKSIVFARLGIVGTSHLLLLCVLAPFVSHSEKIALWQSGLYLLTPYLLTTFLSLICSRRLRGREALYACMGVSVMVSCLSIFLQEKMPFFYQKKFVFWWLAALLFLILPILWEYRQSIYQTEKTIA